MKKTIVMLTKCIACATLMLTGVIALCCAQNLVDKGFLTEIGGAITMVVGIGLILLSAKLS